MKKVDRKCLGRRDASIPWEDVWFASSKLLLKSWYCLITGQSFLTVWVGKIL